MTRAQAGICLRALRRAGFSSVAVLPRSIGDYAVAVWIAGRYVHYMEPSAVRELMVSEITRRNVNGPRP